MSTSAVEVSSEKVKAIWDKRLIEIFCNICIKEILKGNKPAPSFGTLRSEFFEDVDNDIPKENEEENARNDVHISNDRIDGNNQKRKTPEISTSHFKTGRKKSSKKIRGVARLSNQIEKLCNEAYNMS
ncbi:hypothetical protein Goari_011758 [Gossypium aridum]|uniref:Uncharacterized protein n=1 Tax=Gossypium aridum TaxID=34290 RepID=A0A7J8WYT2_GOSAI|nr:hypothetical protein [Gossypium aridum]